MSALYQANKFEICINHTPFDNTPSQLDSQLTLLFIRHSMDNPYLVSHSQVVSNQSRSSPNLIVVTLHTFTLLFADWKTCIYNKYHPLACIYGNTDNH